MAYNELFGAGGTVLVCDYVGQRSEPPVAVLDLEAAGYTVEYLLDEPCPHRLTAADYAEEMMGRIKAPSGTVRAVLAYCVAGPLAQHLAARIAPATDVGIPLVLLDGEAVTAPVILDQFALMARKMARSLGLPADDRTPPPVDENVLREAPEDFLGHLRRHLLALGERAVAAQSGDADEIRLDAEALSDYLLAWIGHLIASYNASWPAWGGPAIQVLSRDQPGLATWEGARHVETVRIDAARGELVRHPETRSTVLSILHVG